MSFSGKDKKDAIVVCWIWASSDSGKVNEALLIEALWNKLLTGQYAVINHQDTVSSFARLSKPNWPMKFQNFISYILGALLTCMVKFV